jgi:ribonuclease J
MPKKDTVLKIIPLGGLDGIGKNMTVFEYGDDMVMVDAGLMFPDDEQPGIDLILPDYTYVLENEDKLRGIIITHGHEDHTGALPYLLQDLTHKVPIYSSKLTLGIIQGKLAEHNIKSPKFREVQDGSTVTLGAFNITFFSMTHSIPAAFGVFMNTPAGNVMHTGDFKLDQTPIDGVRPNYAAINRFAVEGVDVLLSDSTNATRPGFTPSEAAVGPALRHIIKNAPGRVFVASFSSHIHRLQQICDASVAVGRKVVVTGRSMVTNTKVARELGYLRIADESIIDAYDLEKIPDEKIVVLCTGSQGEPLSALARMANGEHKSLSIHEGDTVIISANPIPGNEKSVQGIINSLSKLGCDIYDKSQALVHVSGHGSQEELKLMLAMVKPRYFMPVHGEAQHLRAHAKLAQQVGIPSETSLSSTTATPSRSATARHVAVLRLILAWSMSMASPSPMPTPWFFATASAWLRMALLPAWLPSARGTTLLTPSISPDEASHLPPTRPSWRMPAPLYAPRSSVSRRATAQALTPFARE